ncbi:MAG: glycosyltransferase [Thermomicrobium sp.]|nr:glycosyltransferase [Thermomicrobium sp.]
MAAERSETTQTASRRPRVLRVGLFDACYARNRTTLAALVAGGAEVADLHAAILEGLNDRLRVARGKRASLAFAGRVLVSEAGLLARALPALRWADAILCGYPGQWDAVVWAPVSRSFRRRVVFDPLVTLTETFVEDRRVLAPESLQGRLVRWLDRRALRSADVILADTPQQAAYWATLAAVSLDRFVVVPVGVDEPLFDPVQYDMSAVTRADPDHLRVLFYGTYSPLHGAATIVEAVHRLERVGERLAVVMIGTGQCRQTVQRRAAELGVECISFIDWVPEEELPRWIAWSDVVLGIFGATAKAARVVPNKVYQAMAMGAAIVTRDSPAMRWLAGDGTIALLVPPEDPDALAGALRTLRRPEARRLLGRTARARFERVASTAARARILRPVLEQLDAGWLAPARESES